MRSSHGGWRPGGRWRRPAVVTGLVALLAATALAGCGRALPPASPRSTACAPAWSAAWHAAQQAVPGDQLAGRTLRMVVRPRASGDAVRLRLSNRHGDGPLGIGAVTLARAVGEPPVPVPVGGRPDVLLPPGAEVLTDPVPVPVVGGEPVTVAVFLTVVPTTISSHPVAMRTSWLSGPGDHTRATGPEGFDTTLQSWPVLSGLEVYAPRPDGAVLVIGDSLVDGVGSTPGGDDRFPDQLADRLAAERPMTVLNAGLSRNQLLQDDPPAGGDSPLTRFDVDVARVAGVRDVVLLVGTNDLAEGADADELVAGLQEFAARTRAAGLRVFLTTIPRPRATAGPRRRSSERENGSTPGSARTVPATPTGWSTRRSHCAIRATRTACGRSTTRATACTRPRRDTAPSRRRCRSTPCPAAPAGRPPPAERGGAGRPSAMIASPGKGHAGAPHDR